MTPLALESVGSICLWGRCGAAQKVTRKLDTAEADVAGRVGACCRCEMIHPNVGRDGLCVAGPNESAVAVIEVVSEMSSDDHNSSLVAGPSTVAERKASAQRCL